MSIRTRFAPSPTGYLHIGGVRTALFNWLLARRHHGTYVLRIDDTDDDRNRAEALRPILDGFDWLGLGWDEGPNRAADGTSFGPHAPYFQGQRNPAYEAAALKLVAEGKAYPDYTASADIDAAKERARLARQPHVHRGSNRDVPADENLRQYRERPVPILLKVEPGRSVKFVDAVKGPQDVNTDTIRDPILLRGPSDTGLCRAVYNFATVVDDIAFGITHVARAVEHLSNTPPQILMYDALGATPPTFAHLPQVYYQGKKMSKRDTPKLTADEAHKLRTCGWTDAEIAGRDDLNITAVAFYQALGYLPEALVNYLARLGWSLDGESEFIPLDKLIANFSLDRVVDAPGNYDAKKLWWLQGEYMKLVSVEEKVERSRPFLRKAGLIGDDLDAGTRAKLTKVVAAAGDRVKLFSDVVAFAAPLLKAGIDYDPAAVKKAFGDPAAKDVLRGFADELKSVQFEPAALEHALQGYAASKGLKTNAVVQPVRVAVTGMLVGFGLFETLALLGREETLRRIEQALGM